MSRDHENNYNENDIILHKSSSQFQEGAFHKSTANSTSHW